MSLRRCQCGAQGCSQLTSPACRPYAAVAITRERASTAAEPCLKGHDTWQPAKSVAFLLSVVPVLLPGTSPRLPGVGSRAVDGKALPLLPDARYISKANGSVQPAHGRCSPVVVPTNMGGHDDRRSLPASFNCLRLLLRQAPRRDPGDAGWRSWRSQRERLPSPVLGSSATGLCRSPGWSPWCSP